MRPVSSRVPAAGSPGCAVERHCRVPLSPLGSASLAAALLAGVNRPGSQEDLGSNREPARSLVGNAVSGAEIAPFRLWLLPVFLSASSRRMGWSAAGLLSSGIRPVLCSVSGLQCLRVFPGEVLSLFSPLSLAVLQLGLLSRWFPQIVLRAFRLNPSPKQCNLHFPVQPPLARGGHEPLGYFSAGSGG